MSPPVAPPVVVAATMRPFRLRSMPAKAMPMHRRKFCTMSFSSALSLSPRLFSSTTVGAASFPPSFPTSSSSVPTFFSPSHAFRRSFCSNAFSSSAVAPVPSLDELKGQNAAQIEQLTQAITDFCADSFERNKTLRAHVRPIVTRLGRAICAPKGHSRLVLVGSIASGMAFDASSDIDLAFVYCGANQKEQEKYLQDFWSSSFGFVRSFLEAIAETLRDSCNAHSSKEFHMSQAPEVISHTFVPLIVGKLDNGTNLDIAFPRFDFQSLRNTLMVRYYLQADRRFLLLFHWLRLVFNEMGLKNSKGGLFSSYHTLLLVLYFLSQKGVPDNVLPVFQELPHLIRDKLFAPMAASLVQQLDEMPKASSSFGWKSKCAKSVGELAVELVDFYARFDPWTTAISINSGRTKTVVRQPCSNPERPTLKVFDPFTGIVSTRSTLLGETLVVGFQFLREQMAAGRHLATFPSLDGLAAEFGDHVRSRGFPWAIFLDKNYTPPPPAAATAASTTATEATVADNDAGDADALNDANDSDNGGADCDELAEERQENVTTMDQQQQQQKQSSPPF